MHQESKVNSKNEILKGGRTKSVRLALTLVTLVISTGVCAVPTAPINIIDFPQRDFVSASGYSNDDKVVVRVIHDPLIYGAATGGTTGENAADWVSPQADPADAPGTFSGIVEVNHPGGACWKNQTPDIRPGDRVQIEVMQGTNLGRIDETIVQNITAKRPVQTGPGTVVVHGTGQDNVGVPLPIAILEHRLVAPGELFQVNNKRTLRATSVAGSNGTLAYDPIGPANPNGINWTATYSGLSDADVTIALGAESRGMWLGNALAPALETTVYEIGGAIAPGPGAPCTAPLEVLPPPAGSELVPPSVPAHLIASVDNSNTVTLDWDDSTDNVGVTAYGIYRNGTNIFTLSNPDGSAPAPSAFVDRNTPPGTYTYQVKAFDEVGNGSDFSNTAGPITAVNRIDPGTFESLPRFHEPPLLPINIIAFPSRDFISPSGYQLDDKVTVEILRQGPDGSKIIVSSANGIIPTADGFAEVNHPGGACWEGVTPEIRTGDIVRTIAYNDSVTDNPDHIRSIDQTRIAGVTAFKPHVIQDETLPGVSSDGIVEIHGTALGADGQPLPLDQIEQRMIATRDHFDFNGRRSMRAALGSDGILTYDAIASNNPMGVNWTATYTNLSADDVARMAGGTSSSTGKAFPGADTRIHWLGRDPALLNEATIFENAPDANPPGPAGPGCTRPLESVDTSKPTTPANFTATVIGNQVTFNWSPSTDDWYVAGYRIFDGTTPVANTGSSATSFTLNNVTPGPHNFKLIAFDTASPLGLGADSIAQISTGLGNLYGNLSDLASLSNPGGIVTSDVTPPTLATNLTGTVGTGNIAGNPVATIALTWTASTDNVGVDHYILHRNPSLHSSPLDITVARDAASFTDGLDSAHLLINDSYTYTVEALDAANNHSAQSASITLTVTDAPDNFAPSVPGTPTASVTNPDPVSGKDVAITWAASTDDIGVAGYGVYRNGSATPIATVNGSTLTYTDANLPAGTYSYTVDAFDSVGHRSAISALSDPAVIANDTPTGKHSLIGFPARDFISASGYYFPGHTFHFELIRGATKFISGQIQNTVGDLTGTLEVNHPGGTCWLGTTPDMHAGDVIRIVDETTGIAEQTTVANVTAERPIAINANTVVVHGTAQTADGQPIPVGQLENRLVTGSASLFELNGKRVLRAASAIADGVLAYDSPGSVNWTATYTNLSVDDVFRAVGGTNAIGMVFPGAESRAVWLGKNPLAGNELTIFENGPGVTGGAAGAPCTAVFEGAIALARIDTASVNFPDTQFLPTIAISATQTVTLSNSGGVPMTVTNVYFAGANPGDFIRTGGSCPVSPGVLNVGQSCTVLVAFRPTAVGTRQANLSFSGNAANTTDLTVPLTGIGMDAEIIPTAQAPVAFSAANVAPIAIPAINTGTNTVLAFTKTSVKFGTVTRNTSKDLTVTVKNIGNVAATLNLSKFRVNGAHFSKVSTNCARLGVNRSCSVVVRYTAPAQKLTANGALSIIGVNGMLNTVTTNLTANTR